MRMHEPEKQGVQTMAKAEKIKKPATKCPRCGFKSLVWSKYHQRRQCNTFGCYYPDAQASITNKEENHEQADQL